MGLRAGARAMRMLATTVAAGLTLAFAIPREAGAQAAADPKAEARKLAEQAQDESAAGHHEGALALLRKADATYHAPTIGLLIGRSLVALGRFAEAAEQLEEVATEELAPDAPEPFRTAVKLAGDERAALDAKLGKLVVQVSPADAGATVRLGSRAPRPARGEHVVDAGEPTAVRVEAPGFRPAFQRVTVAAGDASTVSLVLVREEGDIVAPAPEAAPAGASLFHTPWPSVVAGSTTLVTLAVGAGLGASALSDAGDLEDRCGDAACTGASAAERNELRTIQESGRGAADASTAFFVVSGIAAAATTVFVVIWTTSASEPPAGASARVRGGTGWASVDGTF